ncbi:protein prenylyltransferase [Serendipita vermifera]|nr:protein prenylyltransferase [Serendipita vermifera]
MSEQVPAADNTPPLYSTREDWKDVTPIEQSDLANPLVPIFYPPDYKDAMDYFRGITAIGEHSERVLKLTEHIIRMNPAHYFVWQYRYDTLMELQSPLEEEMKLMDELALLHLKHYQVWHHRKLITLKLKKPGRELTFIAKVLAVDAKNYHTWAYRQWLLTYFDDDELWQFEMPFVNLMLDQDVRNNSAWHHRFFVIFDSGARTGDEDREAVLRKELSYVKEKISVAPNNLSAWNYLRGILDKAKRNYGTLREFVVPYTVTREEEKDEEEEEYDLDNPKPWASASLPCALAIEFLADIYMEYKEYDRAAELFTSLSEQHDTMRCRYWDHRVKEALAAKGNKSITV